MLRMTAQLMLAQFFLRPKDEMAVSTVESNVFHGAWMIRRFHMLSDMLSVSKFRTIYFNYFPNEKKFRIRSVLPYFRFAICAKRTEWTVESLPIRLFVMRILIMFP